MNEKAKTTKSVPWHAMEVDAVFGEVASQAEGLTAEEAERRLAEYGPNLLRPAKKRSPWMLLLAQFKNVLIYVLLISAWVTALIGHWVDAAVIAGVVIINAIIGFIQEGKAEKALEAIRDLLSPRATTMRDGKRISLPAEELVPGDVVFVQSGDKVPADLRLFQVKNLRIDEASLTGESVPVEKSVGPVAKKAIIGDRICMAFSGTLVTYGQGSGIVVATGDNTAIGRISALIALAPPVTTRLLLKMAQFGRRLTLAISALAAITFAFGVLIRNYGITDMFLAAVGLAVAAIPEGLPAILTVTLAIGVQRMARRNAIVRRLASVETLGSVTVICSDKTGTLTRNEMTVKAVVTANDLFEVTGVGYDPKGTFFVGGKELSCYFIGDQGVACAEYPELMELARAAMLCNDASVYESNGRWQIHGDPTEGALVVLGIKAGLDHTAEQARWPRTDMIPFESEYRFMATLHHRQDGPGKIFLKGAPERLLEMCSYQYNSGNNDPLDTAYWERRIQEIASRGQRPLAVAFKQTDEDHRHLRFEDTQGGLTLLGLLGIIDPPRGAAISAIRKCRSAGIRVKMITGDHMLTARAIGAEMGIGDGITALTGQALESLTDAQLREAVLNVDVFARVSPEHKLRLVQALQANGEVVAMTGDGVNDAPALKRADIGVAMGVKGTEAAKEAAEMVLADDNFASIEHAVEEGRTIYDNIKKGIMFILPTNGGEAGIIIAAIVFGRMLPITPVQILWINMITAVTLALSLAFEPPEAGVMKRPPRDPNESILSKFLIWRITFVSMILVVGTFGLFLFERIHGAPIETARTMAVNTLVMFEVYYLFNTRYLRDSIFTREGVFGNSYFIVAIGLVIGFQMLFTYFSPMQQLFGTAAITLASWGRVVMISASVFFLVELEKFLFRRFEVKKSRLE
ncbi:MAG: cation-transporting P-type ATPase [Desulfobacteraceae bacterium]|jgi:magnesium-transporting ATPase (P-type)